MKARAAVVAVLAVGACAAPAPAASSLHPFTYTGAGTNTVNIQTGELRELWKGRAKPFGKITTYVTGWITRPTPTTLTVNASMVIVDASGEVLIAACTGSGTLPLPDGAETWACHATGGTGRFRHARGRWTLHIDIHRVSNQDATQKNRFDETGAGRISWKTGHR